jgi:hypothetical protein
MPPAFCPDFIQVEFMTKQPAYSPRSGSQRIKRRDLRQAATGLATASVLAVGGQVPSAMAGTGSCVGSGAISVADARIGECQLQTGDALSVTAPLGSITGVGGLEAGVRVPGTSTGVQITNNGRIVSSQTDGILNEGSITQITNYGRIEGGPFALGVYNDGTINVLNNESGAVIQAGTSSANAIESEPARTLSTLNNSGRIQGGILTYNTIINLSGTSASITGAVSNTGGSVNVLSGAEFTTENTFESSLFRIQSGARLVVGATPHVIVAESLTSDAFRNAGTLHVPEGINAQITGNYTQSGALSLGASSSSSFGRLTVSGNVNLQPSATFYVEVSGTSLAAGDTLAGVVTATGGAP